jgi:hypothetical protein
MEYVKGIPIFYGASRVQRKPSDWRMVVLMLKVKTDDVAGVFLARLSKQQRR